MTQTKLKDKSDDEYKNTVEFLPQFSLSFFFDCKEALLMRKSDQPKNEMKKMNNSISALLQRDLLFLCNFFLLFPFTFFPPFFFFFFSISALLARVHITTYL